MEKIREIGEKLREMFAGKKIYFLLVVPIVFGASFLYFQKNYQVFQVETEIFVPADNSKIENLLVVSQKLSFCEKVAKNSQAFQKQLEDQTDAKKISFCQKTFFLERKNESSIIAIKVIDKNQDEVKEISRAVDKSLVETANQFYNFQNNARIEVVDGYIMNTVLYNTMFFVFLSILTALLALIALKIFYIYREKLLTIGVGLIANEVIALTFDFVLYPFVIWKFGLFEGAIVMTFLSFVICYATILFYDWSKKDWLGLETIKNIKEYEGQGIIGRFMSWIMKKGDFLAFFFLSIQTDPFIVVVYMRHGAHKYEGMKKRDWTIFIGSLLVGNIYWTLVAYTGVSIIESLVKLVKFW